MTIPRTTIDDHEQHWVLLAMLDEIRHEFVDIIQASLDPTSRTIRASTAPCPVAPVRKHGGRESHGTERGGVSMELTTQQVED